MRLFFRKNGSISFKCTVEGFSLTWEAIHTDVGVHVLNGIPSIPVGIVDTIGTIDMPIGLRFTAGAHCAGKKRIVG